MQQRRKSVDQDCYCCIPALGSSNMLPRSNGNKRETSPTTAASIHNTVAPEVWLGPPRGLMMFCHQENTCCSCGFIASLHGVCYRFFLLCKKPTEALLIHDFALEILLFVFHELDGGCFLPKAPQAEVSKKHPFESRWLEPTSFAKNNILWMLTWGQRRDARYAADCSIGLSYLQGDALAVGNTRLDNGQSIWNI